MKSLNTSIFYGSVIWTCKSALWWHTTTPQYKFKSSKLTFWRHILNRRKSENLMCFFGDATNRNDDKNMKIGVFTTSWKIVKMSNKNVNPKIGVCRDAPTRHNDKPTKSNVFSMHLIKTPIFRCLPFLRVICRIYYSVYRLKSFLSVEKCGKR